MCVCACAKCVWRSRAHYPEKRRSASACHAMREACCEREQQVREEQEIVQWRERDRDRMVLL